MNFINPKPSRVCFSYAAYVKNLIHHLKNSNIPVEAGLSEAEFNALESSLNFTFPPDLRSILQEGLPIGPGFPNWRSSSKQQLRILTNLPILGICKQVSKNRFWMESWGIRPDNVDLAVRQAKGFLNNVPLLVPVYRNFYIASRPCMAGNPVFYVSGAEVTLWSYDIAGFFERLELGGDNDDVWRRPRLSNLFIAPAWAAKVPRRIQFWTEMAGWWWGSGELGGCLDDVLWRLRDGGWGEEDVREMMMMDGRDHEEDNRFDDDDDVSLDRDRVEWRVKGLSDKLLRAGWSTEDVVESLGFPDIDDDKNELVPDVDIDVNSDGDGDENGGSCFDFGHVKQCDGEKHNSTLLNFQLIRT